MPTRLFAARRARALIGLLVLAATATTAASSPAGASDGPDPRAAMVTAPLVPAPSSPQALRESSALPLTNAADLVLDEARGRIYVASSTKLAVLDLDGRLLQVVDGLQNPHALVLGGSTLYAAQPNGIARIEVGSGAATLGSLLTTLVAYDMAYASGALWAMTGCSGTPVLTRIGPDGSVGMYPGAGVAACGPLDAAGSRLVVASSVDFGSTLTSLDIGVEPPVVTATAPTGMSSPGQLRLRPDGAVLHVQNGNSGSGAAPARSFDASTLAPLQTYGPGNANAIGSTAARGGLVAMGRAGTGELSLYEGAGTTPRWTVVLGTGLPSIMPRTIEFTADGRRVYAISRDASAPALLTILGTDDPAVHRRGEFHPVDPARAYDSRTGARITQTEVVLAGVAGIPSSAVAAVAVNITVTDPSAAGYLSAFPAGAARPTASTLNFVAGQTVPNLAIVGVGPGVRLGLFASAPAHVVVDVVGWFGDDSAPSGARFHAILPFRWFDTRTDPRGDSRVRPVGEGDLVFASATGGSSAASGHVRAVALNVTATNTTADSYLAVTPFGAPRGSSNLNWRTGDVVPNAVISRVDDAQGRVQFRNAYGSVDVIADSTGYWDDGTVMGGARLEPVEPRRLVDTRTGQLPAGSLQGSVTRLAAGQALSFRADGGLPDTASSVVLNVTAVAPAAAGYLSVFPLGVPVAQGMQTSLVNFAPGETRPNMSIMPIGLGGEIVVVNASGGSIDVLVDITGYFA